MRSSITATQDAREYLQSAYNRLTDAERERIESFRGMVWFDPESVERDVFTLIPDKYMWCYGEHEGEVLTIPSCYATDDERCDRDNWVTAERIVAEIDTYEPRQPHCLDGIGMVQVSGGLEGRMLRFHNYGREDSEVRAGRNPRHQPFFLRPGRRHLRPLRHG